MFLTRTMPSFNTILRFAATAAAVTSLGPDPEINPAGPPPLEADLRPQLDLGAPPVIVHGADKLQLGPLSPLSSCAAPAVEGRSGRLTRIGPPDAGRAQIQARLPDGEVIDLYTEGAALRTETARAMFRGGLRTEDVDLVRAHPFYFVLPNVAEPDMQVATFLQGPSEWALHVADLKPLVVESLHIEHFGPPALRGEEAGHATAPPRVARVERNQGGPRVSGTRLEAILPDGSTLEAHTRGTVRGQPLVSSHRPGFPRESAQAQCLQPDGTVTEESVDVVMAHPYYFVMCDDTFPGKQCLDMDGTVGQNVRANPNARIVVVEKLSIDDFALSPLDRHFLERAAAVVSATALAVGAVRYIRNLPVEPWRPHN